MNKIRKFMDKPITWGDYFNLCKWATIIYAALYGIIYLWYELEYNGFIQTIKEKIQTRFLKETKEEES